MKSLAELLNQIKKPLISVSKNVGLYEAIDSTKTHIIYAPDTEPSQVETDNKKEIQTIQGSIDLFALPRDQELADDIQEALNEEGISFFLNSVQFEDFDKNNFIHYEWIFEVS